MRFLSPKEGSQIHLTFISILCCHLLKRKTIIYIAMVDERTRVYRGSINKSAVAVLSQLKRNNHPLIEMDTRLVSHAPNLNPKTAIKSRWGPCTYILSGADTLQRTSLRVQYGDRRLRNGVRETRGDAYSLPSASQRLQQDGLVFKRPKWNAGGFLAVCLDFHANI